MTHDELVKAMCGAYNGIMGFKITACMADHKSMSAALSVAMEEMLGQPTPLEFDAAINATMLELDAKYHPDGPLHQYAMCRLLLLSRHSRLTKPKSAEERVIVIPAVDDGFSVQVDHKQVFWQHAEKDAQIYRLGLIQQLKEQSQ
jgi:hypothetical protein